MCGRFVLRTFYDVIDELMGPLLPWPPTLPPVPRYNIAPTQDVAIIRTAGAGRREITPARWGLIPAWNKGRPPAKTFNARCETAATKPTYRGAMRSRRCLIPADGFYEPDRRAAGASPFFIHMADDHPFALAGLWERWRDDAGHTLDSCTILTTEPNALLATFHERMPVIVAPDDYAEWLDPATPPEKVATMLKSHPAEGMEAFPVEKMGSNAPKGDRGDELGLFG